MLNTIIDILKGEQSINGYLINEIKTKSAELFFVKNELNMNRKKNVHHINLTVYKDFEENGKKYKGSASCVLSPSMTNDEIKDKISRAAYSASFVKNPYFELVEKSDKKIGRLAYDENIFASLPKIVECIYENDNYKNGKVNSCEIFVEEHEHRILNSNGVDENYYSNSCDIELVIDWMEQGEEIEVIEILSFSSVDEDEIKKSVKSAFVNAKYRAAAKPISDKDNLPVVLTGESVNEFLRYYVDQAEAVMIYKKYSQAQVGKNIQGENIKGDKLNVTLLPEIKNSPASTFIDNDGVKMSETELYKDGKLMRLFGDNRHSKYLNIDVTGILPNVKVEGGKHSKEELLSGRCLEIIEFSAFQTNPMTGDFGGEIRLALLHDNGEITPVTGGAVTGNVSKVQANMLLSKDTGILKEFDRPQAVKIFDFNLSI